MKSLLAGLLALVLGLALGLTVIAWTADAAILQPAPVLAAIPADTYPAIAKNMPAALGQLTPLSADDKLILAQQIDPGLVRQITSSVVTQELKYLHGQGSVPQLDLRELAARLHAEGAPLPPQLFVQLDQPIKLSSSAVDQTARPLVSAIDRLRWIGLFVSAAVVLLIWVLGAHYRYRTLAKGLLGALLLALISLAFVELIPSLVSSGLSTSQLASLAPTIKAALSAAAHGYAHGIIQAMIGLFGGAVALIAAHVVLGRKPKRHH